MTERSKSGAPDERAWSPNRWMAVVVRILVAISPFVAAFLVARMAAPAFWHPGGWTGAAAFFVQGAIAGTVAALLAGRAAQRLLPLAALLNMTQHGPRTESGPNGRGPLSPSPRRLGVSDLRYRLWPFRHD